MPNILPHYNRHDMFEGEIFDDGGALTAAYLASRGYCCGNGCRNCPYTPRHGGPDADTLDPQFEKPVQSEAQ